MTPNNCHILTHTQTIIFCKDINKCILFTEILFGIIMFGNWEHLELIN